MNILLLIVVTWSQNFLLIPPVMQENPDPRLIHSDFKWEDTSKEKKIYDLKIEASLKSRGCADFYVLDDEYIVPKLYQVTDFIVASGTLLSGNTIFRARHDVYLDPGFQVLQGAELEIQIGDCIF